MLFWRKSILRCAVTLQTPAPAHNTQVSPEVANSELAQIAAFWEFATVAAGSAGVTESFQGFHEALHFTSIYTLNLATRSPTGRFAVLKDRARQCCPGRPKTPLFIAREPAGAQNGRSDLPGCCRSALKGCSWPAAVLPVHSK